jgi:class 3 adenylate cyclase
MTAPTEFTVLFADVSGSTRLYETLGDERALATVGHCMALMREVCAGCDGRVVKTIGDEVMAVFSLADQAAQAAASMHGRISAEPFEGGSRIAIRVGFHHGPALEADGDVYGDSVNVAARLAGIAHASQVITSGTTVAMLSPWLRVRARPLAALTVKGKTRDLDVWELLWQESADDLTTLATRVSVQRARLKLRHGEREIVLDEQWPALALGRDARNDVVIADRLASRLHGRIERRRDRFVLVDHSSNGTFVTPEGEAEIPLRREEFVLRGRGRISFGHAHATDPRETVDFECEA